MKSRVTSTQGIFCLVSLLSLAVGTNSCGSTEKKPLGADKDDTSDLESEGELKLAALPSAATQGAIVVPGRKIIYPAGRIQVFEQRTALPAKPFRCLDYKVTLSENWVSSRGGKLPGLGGGTGTTGCKSIDPRGWSTRSMWRGAGSKTTDVKGLGFAYVYDQSRTGSCGTNLAYTSVPADDGFVGGKTYRLSQCITVNTPGRADGKLEMWKDGRKVVNKTGMTFRGTSAGASEALVDRFLFSTFYGGADPTWAPPVETAATFSDFYITECAIDPTASALGTCKDAGTPTDPVTPPPTPAPTAVPSVQPTGTPGPKGPNTPQPTAPPVSPSSLTVKIVTKSSWQSGFCADIIALNSTTQPMKGWVMRLALKDAKLSNGWKGKFENAAGVLTITPASYLSTLAPGAKATLGFCATWAGSGRTAPQVL